jgi:predicted DNA-binding protein
MSEKISEEMLEATITFVISSEFKKRIKEAAKRERRTASNWIRVLIERELYQQAEDAFAEDHK